MCLMISILKVVCTKLRYLEQPTIPTQYRLRELLRVPGCSLLHHQIFSYVLIINVIKS